MRFEDPAAENLTENPRLKMALADFIMDILEHPGEKDYMPWEMDISDPHEADMEAIGKKNFSISNLVVAPGVKRGRSYHFYVGRTEFHIAGRAAQKVEEGLSEAA